MKEIKLSSGEIALVDDEDFEYLNQFKWHINGGYAARSAYEFERQTTVFMHTSIMNTPEGMVTDHKDHNKLNNQRSNLRICSRSENQMNIRKHIIGSSKYKGVCVRRKGGRIYWSSRILANGKRFEKWFPFTESGEIAAAKHYDILAAKYFKSFACTNNLN